MHLAKQFHVRQHLVHLGGPCSRHRATPPLSSKEDEPCLARLGPLRGAPCTHGPSNFFSVQRKRRHTTYSSFYKWTKLLTLEMTIFGNWWWKCNFDHCLKKWSTINRNKIVLQIEIFIDDINIYFRIHFIQLYWGVELVATFADSAEKMKPKLQKVALEFSSNHYVIRHVISLNSINPKLT